MVSPEYKAWDNMKARCYNPKRAGYEYYGGRGITVCKEWKHDFHQFFKDMGPRPSSKHSLDRIDTNGNYSSENCRWATPKMQAHNKRRQCMSKEERKKKRYPILAVRMTKEELDYVRLRAEEANVKFSRYVKELLAPSWALSAKIGVDRLYNKR